MNLPANVAVILSVILATRIHSGLGCAVDSMVGDGKLDFVHKATTTEITHVGATKSLDCRAVNFCSITWYKDDIPFPWARQEDTAHALPYPEDKNQLLVFKNTDFTDEGVYTCVVSNNHQNITRSIRLVVAEAPYNGPPIPLEDDEGSCADQMARIGETVTFYCEFYVGKYQTSTSSAGWLKDVKGQNTPVEWISDIETTRDQSYRNDSEGVIGARLKIIDIRENAFGTWKVNVENGQHITIALSVKPVPTEVHIVADSTAGLAQAGSKDNSSGESSAGTIKLLAVLLAVVSSLLILTMSLLLIMSLRIRRNSRAVDVEPETEDSDCSKLANNTPV